MTTFQDSGLIDGIPQKARKNMPPPLPRTVILDYYDSYTNNILTLFTKLYSDEEVLKKVVVIKHDRYTWNEFKSNILPNIDCVILSPGPGRPDNPYDIGFALDLLRSHPLPILGVCLGHQAIGVAFEAKIVNTPRITHGHVISVSPTSPATGLFDTPEWRSGGEGEFDVVVYNSLTVDPTSLPAELEVTAWSNPPTGEERTIQGLRHREHPIWGVQYHPESISSTRGHHLLLAFLSQVHKHHSHPTSFPVLLDHVTSSCSYRVTASTSSSSSRRAKPGTKTPMISPYPTPPISPSGSSTDIPQTTIDEQVAFSSTRADQDRACSSRVGRLKLVERRFGNLGREAKTADVFQAVMASRKGKERAIGEVWLDGETPTRPTTTSISSPSFLLTYNLAHRRVTLHQASTPPIHLILHEETFWNWFGEGQKLLSASLDEGTISDGSRNGDSCKGSEGFKGGWVGWFGYEMKQESLAGYSRSRSQGGSEEEVEGEEVDAAMAWCDRILERQPDGEWVARGIISQSTENGITGDQDNQESEGMIAWLSARGISFSTPESDFTTYSTEIESTLSSLPTPLISPIESFPTFTPISSGSEYKRQIQICREAIRQGESYELTLTTKFTAKFPSSTDPLSLYLRLRSSNPAYYSTYLSFPSLRTGRGEGLSVISSSPERFLKIEKGVVEMMPIKGTRARVKPGTCICQEIGRECEAGEKCEEIARKEDERRGEELRLDPKERAENLMIVDLIRADLLSSCPPSTVIVPKLIALESYGVHNLVTTVRGQSAPNVGTVEAVKRCFPPGSMTGAPKLRSVGLLEGIEDEGLKREIYSGCLGYFSIDGSTDLSVVIRSMVLEGDHLSLGAGGAITWLSDPEKEWEEVLTKVGSVLGREAVKE